MLFDDAELIEVETVLTSDRLNIQRSDSTPETRERYAFLKTKRIDDCWHEGPGGRYLYRMGSQG